MRIACVALVLAALSGASGCGGADGPKKYPVRGTVTVNGKPAALVRVQFRHADQSLPGNLKVPAGMTDETGSFALSTSGDRDGAVPGDYTVTFEWLSGNDLGAYDRFGGRFAKPEPGSFKARVEPRDNDLPAFALTIPEGALVNKPVRPQ
jgi:hypothetical protein